MDNLVRPIELRCENDDCQENTPHALSESEFSEWIEDCDIECESCGEELSVSGLKLKCYLCDADIDYMSLADALHWIQERCPYCAGHKTWNVDFYTITVADSWQEAYSIYDWTADGRSDAPLKRKDRTDYWEGLVHFCTAEEFILIYKERVIRAASTGLYGKRNPKATKAVCLSETTQPNWQELKDTHGEYGFVFRKKDIIAVDGTPAIYLTQAMIDGLKEKGQSVPMNLWPYLTKLKIPSVSPGKKHDFLHEREWRVPQDIVFDDVAPYAVTFPKNRPEIEGEGAIIAAAREFQELSEHGRPAEEDQIEPTGDWGGDVCF